VSYSTREGAERAIREVGGTQIGSRVVRCGWAHHKRDTLQGADYLTIDQVRLSADAVPLIHSLGTGSAWILRLSLSRRAAPATMRATAYGPQRRLASCSLSGGSLAALGCEPHASCDD